MPSVNELISMGYGGYAGWNDASANADYGATGGSGKYTGGGGGGGSSSSGGGGGSLWDQLMGSFSGMSSGGSSGGGGGVDPNNANSIKAAYSGYAGWNDSAAIIADFKATGGAGKGGPSSSSGAGWEFNWDQAEQDALEKLKPYYQEVLAEAQGDTERAKRIMEEDYSQGKRYREEDQQVSDTQLNVQDPREDRDLLENMNKRGILKSSIRNEEEGYVDDQQQKRREAVTRALARREEVAGIQKTRGIEDINTKFSRYSRDLEQEKREKASSMANMDYQKKWSRFTAEADRFA